MALVFMIELRGVTKNYMVRGGRVVALDDVSLSIGDGEVFGVIGFSGAGKSTLVRCINLLERPDAGTVVVGGKDLCSLGRRELDAARRKIGMIFQQFNLLEQRTVAKNVRYPLEVAGFDKAAADARVAELLETVGLSDKARAYPAQLSGGQKQRVAIARALACDPDIILCDEATSALDPITTNSVLDLLADLNARLGVTIVLITHEMRVARRICDRVAVVEGGRVCEVGPASEVLSRPKSAAARKLLAVEEIDGPGENAAPGTDAGADAGAAPETEAGVAAERVACGKEASR